MKRKERPGGSVKKMIRPVLYYPDAAEDEPSQVIMPSSPPLGPRSSPDRGLRDSRRLGPGRRRSAVDNIGYEPENIPTPRASLYFSTQSSSPTKFSARVQPASIKRIASASRLFVPAPPAVAAATPTADDEETGPDDASDYVIDTDDERPGPSVSPFKPTRPFKPPRRLSSSPTNARSTYTTLHKPRSHPKPQSTEVINLLSSSDSEPEPAPPTRLSESPSLGTTHPRAPSPEIELLDPPPSHPSSDVEELALPRPPAHKARRRIESSPVVECTPWRHVPSELRRRPLAPEFGDSSEFSRAGSRSGSTPILNKPSGSASGSGSSRPSMPSRESEDMFFRPTTRQSTKTRVEMEIGSSPESEHQNAPLPPSSPPQIPPSTPTPTLTIEPTPTPAPEPSTSSKTPVRVLRMDCILLPRPSRATLNALARFEAATSRKGKGKMSVVVEIPQPRRKQPVQALGLGKGMGKGAYAAREEGRWESSSPVREGEGSSPVRVDGGSSPVRVGRSSSSAREDMDMDMEVDEIDLIRIRDDEDEIVIVDDDGPSSADSEPEISFVGIKTPSAQKSKSKKSRKRRSNPDPSPPASPTRTPRTSFRGNIITDPLVDLASSYPGLSRAVKDSGDKYCHCCRTSKGGRLKMRCTNQVSRSRRRGRWNKHVEGEIHVCGTWWCQRCALKHDIEFDPLIEEFTCPMCDDTCVCDVCRKKRGQEPLGRFGNVVITGRRSSGAGPVEEPEQEEEEEQEQADEPEASNRSSTLSEPPPLGPEPDPEEEDEPDFVASSTGDPNAKRAGYAELMRQRGPTKWHGRRTPPPLRRASHQVAVSMNDVYIPRGPVEGTETTVSTTISPSRGGSPAVGGDNSLVSNDNPPVLDVGASVQDVGPSVHDVGLSMQAVGLSMPDDALPVQPDGPHMQDDTPMIAESLLLQGVLLGSFDADYSANADTSFMGADSGELAIEMEELLRVDELTSADPGDITEAILLGPPSALPDDDSVFAGLDANLRAAVASRHFYDPALHLQQMRFGNMQDVMLASPDMGLFGFEPEHHLGVSIAPAQLSRSPTADPYQPVDQPVPPVIFEPESAQPAPPMSEFEPEPEAMSDLTMAESAKSTDLETPSPQFDADAGVLEGGHSGSELQDLFDGQVVGASEDVSERTEVPKSSSAAQASESANVESTPVEPPVEPSDPSSTSLTFVAPTPDNAIQVQKNLKRRFQAQTQAQPPDQGRVTRSRSRRSL